MSESSQNGSFVDRQVLLISAAALTLLGASTFIHQALKKRSQDQRNQQILRSTSSSLRNNEVSVFLQKAPKRVKICFDQNDEAVSEDFAKLDPYNYYHKYHTVEIQYGVPATQDHDYKYSLDKITKEILTGEKSVDNAQIFIQSLQKSKKQHLENAFDNDIINIIEETSEQDSKEQDEQECKKSINTEQSSVILDINPDKFEKAKDHLFFDFFSLYAKNFISEKSVKRNKSVIY